MCGALLGRPNQGQHRLSLSTCPAEVLVWVKGFGVRSCKAYLAGSQELASILITPIRLIITPIILFVNLLALARPP